MALAHWCCRWDQDGDIVNAGDVADCDDDDSAVMLMLSVMFLMQKLDSSSLSASSLQKWQAAPLCNGKFKVIKLGNGNHTRLWVLCSKVEY